jgi:metal-responsive CopG/Arc/MetJ family transcriptional regulator
MLAPVMIRFPQAMLDDIDAIRASRRDEPDRSSIIRELIAEALEAREKTKR